MDRNFYERQNDFIIRKEAKLDVQRKEELKKSQNGCTFKPKLISSTLRASINNTTTNMSKLDQTADEQKTCTSVRRSNDKFYHDMMSYRKSV
jgi:hypothetical protein